MPAIIDQNLCINAPRCFAAPVCPQEAIAFRVELGQVTIESELCGDCPGPCTNFCDPNAIKYAPTYEEFALLKGQIEGTLTAEAAATERARLKEAQAAAEAAAKAGPVTALTAATFEQFVRAAELPIVIDFWADWCGPCKQMAPIFQRLAEQYAGQMLFAKVDTDQEQVLAQRLGIRSLPTLLFVYRGQVIDGVVGALPAPQLQARIQQVLSLVQQAVGGPTAAATPPPPPTAGSPGQRPTGRPGAGGQPPGMGAARGPQGPNGGQRPKIILP
jgi:thioredoxin